jgi:hypothetical protein
LLVLAVVVVPMLVLVAVVVSVLVLAPPVLVVEPAPPDPSMETLGPQPTDAKTPTTPRARKSTRIRVSYRVWPRIVDAARSQRRRRKST